MTCLDCKEDLPVVEDDRDPLCYRCLYNRYIAYKAENAKNFRLLCATEERLALVLSQRGSTQ